MKLFAIYVGGSMPGANIEVHDMRFIVAPSIRETYSELRRQWWGSPTSLHLDCWAEITHADGYRVELRPEPSAGREKLWFVNLGGYDGHEFAERHQNVFVIATSIAGAKARALEMITGWDEIHRDDLYEAERAFRLDEVATLQRLHIHLTPDGPAAPVTFTSKYIPIGRNS